MADEGGEISGLFFFKFMKAEGGKKSTKQLCGGVERGHYSNPLKSGLHPSSSLKSVQ